MQITDIIPDFSKLSDEQIQEVIRGVRRSRTTVKEVSNVKRPAKKAAETVKATQSALSKLSANEMALLKQMFNKK